MLARALVPLTAALLTASGALALDAADPQAPRPPAPSFGAYAWPVTGPVVRGFEAPAGPFGPGHRGIDIEAPAGRPVRAAQAGTVAFAGKIAGELHVSIDHPDGVRTSYAFLSSIDVRAGAPVVRGERLGAVGAGHAGSPVSHLHFGARYAGQYIDPVLLLEARSLVGLIRLAPLEPDA